MGFFCFKINQFTIDFKRKIGNKEFIVKMFRRGPFFKGRPSRQPGQWMWSVRPACRRPLWLRILSSRSSWFQDMSEDERDHTILKSNWIFFLFFGESMMTDLPSKYLSRWKEISHDLNLSVTVSVHCIFNYIYFCLCTFSS